jgi:hypothetical protein
MEQTDLTIEILKGIRDEVTKTNERLVELRTELVNEVHETNGRLVELRSDLVDRVERVERRQTETELRLATELVAVGGAVREVRDLLREDRALRERVNDHERRLSAIERHTG